LDPDEPDRLMLPAQDQDLDLVPVQDRVIWVWDDISINSKNGLERECY
jgi:hypothetical protein